MSATLDQRIATAVQVVQFNPVDTGLRLLADLIDGVLANAALVRSGLALLLGGLLVYWTVMRVFGASDDPSIAYQSSSDVGSKSFHVSGVYLIGGVVAVMALLTWEEFVGNLGLQALLGGAVVVHYVIEKRERDAL